MLWGFFWEAKEPKIRILNFKEAKGGLNFSLLTSTIFLEIWTAVAHIQAPMVTVTAAVSVVIVCIRDVVVKNDVGLLYNACRVPSVTTHSCTWTGTTLWKKHQPWKKGQSSFFYIFSPMGLSPSPNDQSTTMASIVKACLYKYIIFFYKYCNVY